jgi:plastocyanin
MRRSSVKLAALMLCSSVGGLARADVLLDQTDAVGLPTVAAPSIHRFTAAAAQALTVTLTDFQAPAAFGALQIAVTMGDVLVGSASVDATTHTATVAVPAAAGNYVLFVVGTPATTQGFGSFGVCVSLASDATHACIAEDSYSDSLTTPSPPSSAISSLLNTVFTTSALGGTYTLTLTDDAFPVALNSVSAGVFQGTTPIAVDIPAGTPTALPLVANAPYQLLAAAAANSTTPAGLYGIRITDPSGVAVFDRSLPVGSLADGTFLNNPTAQALTLTLSDYAYPATLATLGAAVTFGGGPALGKLTAAGTVSNIFAPEGSLQVWTYAAAGAQPGVYGLNLASSSSTLLSTTTVVNPGNASAAGNFAFTVDLPAAGTYQLSVADFQFPGALTSLSSTIAQNGAVLTQNAGGTFTAAAGVAIIEVDAQPPQSGSGIFDVSVQTTGASPQILLDQTQAVGGLFNTQTLNLGTTGGYNVTLTDLEFPQDFQDLAVVVSQGSQILGKIYGGGTFGFTGTPGAKYVFTFVATPKATSASASIVPDYGLYSLNVASTPPTVMFSSSASTVTAGGAVTLTWSSTNATTCTASGGTGWTGSEMTSGSLAVSVGATETLTLTCTGPGGTAAQSVTVTVTPPSGKSGGGSIDLGGIAALLILWGASRRRNLQARKPARAC